LFKDEIDDIFDAMPTYSNDIAEKNVLLNVLTKNEQFKTVNINAITKIDNKINIDKGKDNKTNEIKNIKNNIVNTSANEVSKEDNLIDF